MLPQPQARSSLPWLTVTPSMSQNKMFPLIFLTTRYLIAATTMSLSHFLVAGESLHHTEQTMHTDICRVELSESRIHSPAQAFPSSRYSCFYPHVSITATLPNSNNSNGEGFRQSILHMRLLWYLCCCCWHNCTGCGHSYTDYIVHGRTQARLMTLETKAFGVM